MFFLFLYNIILSLCFASAQTAVVYDENQTSTQFHIILWISITFVVAFLSGIYGIFQVANTKDSLLYSKIGTSNSTN
ncbi:conserved Plasmodium protein, unknown function [Plasmodium yoelii]|uniref:Uncharacterized protein n=2 Tax=Plasmodium yoelii TaxID=5861 RepID=A0AAE9WL68_PLAYO|nr:conserved Plasmodium protein, unknown function [Plasmodium yoelii]WBY54560.1 hypothetical protein Py17XNL_000104844 [Plasmodium yoelii yoelii]CDU15959.1 conserved Plasmodium protein, unknown function [Plasmodium yoelii]VTZ71554.1 conserved Plasmodium protein, unknown function [Plasmodium yoelii]|eukprot:XP_022811269.1 conserved Plasmodium protein, unknown function [Plasmodium yoelii]